MLMDNMNFEKMLKDFMKDSKNKQKEIKKYYETKRDKKIKAERQRKQRQKYDK